MGNLLKILSNKDANKDDFYHVFVDFESKFLCSRSIIMQ